MTALAWNGILYAAMTLAVGIAWGNTLLVAAAFAMAGASYIVNMLDELGIDWPAVRNALVVVTVGVGVIVFALVVSRLA